MIEAQTSGLPAAVYDIGGPRACIVPGESGFAVPFGDEAESFEKVELLVNDEVVRRRMGRAARQYATTQDWKAVLDGLLDIHRGLLDDGITAGLRAGS